MPSEIFDVAIVGEGLAGSSIARAAVARGLSVYAVDRHKAPHAKGSSHGETRLFRMANFEGAHYTPLAKYARRSWLDLAEDQGARLFEATGVLHLSCPDGDLLGQVMDATASEPELFEEVCGMPVGLKVPKGWRLFNDRQGGYLYAEPCIEALLKAASAPARAGQRVTIESDKSCTAVGSDENGAWVEVDDEVIRAKTVVVAAGAWLPTLLHSFDPEKLPLSRQTLHWFEDPKKQFTLDAGFKPFVVEWKKGEFIYGFPTNAAGRMKIASHVAGDLVSHPREISQKITDADKRAVLEFAKKFLTGLGKWVEGRVCMYPGTVDGNFLIGSVPGQQQVIVCAGLGGHGFKFGPALGEIVTDLIQKKKPTIAFDHRRFSPTRLFADRPAPPDRTNDFTLLDKYQAFSAEILRLSLLIIGAAGFIFAATKDGFFSGFPKVFGGRGPWGFLFVLGMALCVLSAGTAAWHRYVSSDAMAQLLVADRNPDTIKGKKATKALHARLKESTHYITSATYCLIAGLALTFFVFGYAFFEASKDVPPAAGQSSVSCTGTHYVTTFAK